MSDKTTLEPTLKAGQPEGEGQEKFLTRAEYQAGQEQLLEELKKSNVGLAGSMGETVGKRISTDLRSEVRSDIQQLEKLIEAQKAAGVEISPAQENAMKQKVIQDALTKEPEEPEPDQIEAPEGAPAQEPGQEPDPITQAAWSMMEERKVEIMDEDPEFEILDMSSPYKFLLSVDKAITAKETRLQKEPPPEEPENKGSTHARIPGAGAGGPTGSLLPDGTPPLDRLQSHYKKQGT